MSCRKGETVNVYQDPLTCQDMEGRATLIKFLGNTDPELGERWLVHFVGDAPGDTYPRWIKD